MKRTPVRGVVITVEEAVALFLRAVDLEDRDRADVWLSVCLAVNDPDDEVAADGT